MKRDMDLAREILFAIEENDDEPGTMEIELPGRSALYVSYHVTLLAEAGLIEAENTTSMDQYEYLPTRLTWAGHEFLDAVRDDTVWKRAKSETLAKTGQLTFEVIKATLMGIARQGLGLP